ncbi:hypothetical protein [uncultured Shewanella sp.]|uniref:hypothetical protein n=1 Tax=uncultured Shewanella sp. TaxID=173975 RepID=UPI0026177B0F|nr:hypothetical protein [uncultured Shewanella sp.]
MAKAVMRQSDILQRGEINTLSLLLLFLLSIASFTFGSLYFESQHKNKLLSSEVQKLKSSQVLLMVPDEQAEVMAIWMAENPHFVSTFVDKATQGESTVLPIGPGAMLQSLGQSASSQPSELIVEKLKSESVSRQEAIKVKALSEKDNEQASNGATAKTEQQQTVALLQEPYIAAELMDKTEERHSPSQVKDTAFSGKRVAKQAVTLSESADGVKLISLPHGGIRVTTREPEK